MRAFWIAAAVAIAAAPAAAAQDALARARAALERYLALNAAGNLDQAEARAMSTGEALAHGFPTLGPVQPPDAVVAAAAGRVVARLPASAAMPRDLYLYLVRDEGAWKVEAFRSLALTALPFEVREQLRAKANRNPGEEKQLRNIELVLASDRALSAHFAAHRADFLAVSRLPPDSRTEDPEVAALVDRLDAAALGRTPEGRLALTVGGMLDNEVGYLFVPKGGQPPAIDKSSYIWVEPVGDGWYLYRTT